MRLLFLLRLFLLLLLRLLSLLLLLMLLLLWLRLRRPLDLLLLVLLHLLWLGLLLPMVLLLPLALLLLLLLWLWLAGDRSWSLGWGCLRRDPLPVPPAGSLDRGMVSVAQGRAPGKDGSPGKDRVCVLQAGASGRGIAAVPRVGGLQVHCHGSLSAIRRPGRE